jgi:hypothetical protein
MCGEASPELTVHWCVVCGPVIKEEFEFHSVTYHQPVEHPALMEFDEEDNPH